jgi:hypothetical protein
VMGLTGASMGFGRWIAGDTESNSKRFLILLRCGMGGDEFSGIVACCGGACVGCWVGCVGGVISLCDV